MIEKEEKTEYVTCNYIEDSEFIWIRNLKVKEGFEGKGHGTRFMKEFLTKFSKPVCLTILYNRPLNFYLRLGFIVENVSYFDDEGGICDAELSYSRSV